MDATANNSPKYTRPEYKKMAKRWAEIKALLELSEDVRDCELSPVILPMMPEEDKDVYRDRVNNTFLWNSVEQTLNGMVGLLTNKGFSIDSIKNDELRNQVQYPIRGGGSFRELYTRFCNAVMQYGHAMILVTPGENKASTLAEEKKRGLRPYWEIVVPENIINWRAGSTDKAKDSDLIVVREYIEKEDGEFGFKSGNKYLVLKQDGYYTYSEYDEKVEESGSGTYTDSRGKALNFIPVAVAYYTELAPFVSKPPLSAMASLSIEHTRLKSNSNLAIRMHQFPVAVFTGVADDEKGKFSTIKMGPTVGLQLPLGTDFKFQETTGSALNIGLKQIERNEQLQNEMSFRQLVGDRNISRDVSASEATIKNYQKLSPLAKAGVHIEDALNRALDIHAAYLGVTLSSEERIKLNFDIQSVSISSDEVRVMIELVQNKVIPVDLVFEKLTNGTWFDTTEKYDEVIGRIDDFTNGDFNASETQI